VSPGTLEDLLAAAGEHPCPEPELLCLLVLAETLGELATAHALGAWHGRLEPRSLRLCGAPPGALLAGSPRDPRLLLSGCRRPSGEGGAGTMTGVPPSAVPWSPPESRRGEPGGPAADLWAAAAMVAALLRGLRCAPSPELGRLLASLQAPRPSSRPRAEEAGRRARELALRALAAWDERRRPAAAGEAADEVRYAPPTSQRLDASQLLDAGRLGDTSELVDARQLGDAGHPAGSGASHFADPHRRARDAARRTDRPGAAWRVPRPGRWLGVGAVGPGRWQPLGGLAPFTGGGRDSRALWVALAPSAAAGLLCALLAAVLLLGG
jgi:hypothetical protein